MLNENGYNSWQTRVSNRPLSHRWKHCSLFDGKKHNVVQGNYTAGRSAFSAAMRWTRTWPSLLRHGNHLHNLGEEENSPPRTPAGRTSYGALSEREKFSLRCDNITKNVVRGLPTGSQVYALWRRRINGIRYRRQNGCCIQTLEAQDTEKALESFRASHGHRPTAALGTQTSLVIGVNLNRVKEASCHRRRGSSKN